MHITTLLGYGHFKISGRRSFLTRNQTVVRATNTACTEQVCICTDRTRKTPASFSCHERRKARVSRRAEEKSNQDSELVAFMLYEFLLKWWTKCVYTLTVTQAHSTGAIL